MMGKKDYEIYMDVNDIARTFDISRKAVQKWISTGKVSTRHYIKVTSPGRQGFKYFINPVGAPEPHRSKWLFIQDSISKSIRNLKKPNK